MLPFLSNKRKIGSIAEEITAERSPEADEPEDGGEGMLVAAQNLIEAVHSKNPHAVAAALQAAFELADSKEGNE